MFTTASLVFGNLEVCPEARVSNSFAENMNIDDHAQVAVTRVMALNSSDLERSLTASNTIGYKWDVTTDELSWTGNVSEVLSLNAVELATGKQFAAFLDPENITTRFDAVVNSNTRDSGSGVPFQIEYQFRLPSHAERMTTWVEDIGIWHAGENGRPAYVYGRMHRIDERHKHDQNMVLMSTSDPLTGTINRTRMTEMLGEVIHNSIREHSSCGFAIAMVSNLGVISEAYGYEVADEVILQIAQRLRGVMRSGDVIARYSGRKFGFVLNNCSPMDLASAGERLLAAVRENVIETTRGPVWAILSLGAVSIPESTHDTVAAIAFAEEALSEARAKPTDACVVYKHSESRNIKHALNARCASEIVNCLKEGSFKLAFQPVQDAATGKTVMHEALLRMIEGTGEIIPAGHLIPVAEHIGLIRLIDRNVVQMAITTLHSYPDARLSINISDNSATDTRWNQHLIELLGAEPAIAQRIVVELPETTAFSGTPAIKQFIQDLQAIGCQVAIDKFGAGYTSFRNVRDLKINIVKLDGSYCRNLKDNPESRYYAKCLIDLGKAFGLRTVAEWVETSDDAEVLRELGIDYLQGHFLGDASIEPPWSTMESTSFMIGEEPEQLIADAAADTVQVAPVEEVKVEGPTYTSDYDYEDGLAKLSATLAMLDARHSPAPEPLSHAS
jgi:diguanylate cyclase (GGDEF)-like protein